MSGNLSFTQELRANGFIISEDNNKETINTTEKITSDNTNQPYNESVIYIGKKPAMNYVLAINTRMSEGLDQMTIKARGKTISKAVDVAEIVTNRFVTDANDDQVKISTEEIIQEDGSKTNVSNIEIIIQK